MKKFRHKAFIAFVVLGMLLALVSLPAAENPGDKFLDLLQEDFAAEVLPRGIQIETTYVEAAGTPVGMVEFVENDAYVIHMENPSVAYKLSKGKSIFQGDVLITLERSKLTVYLNDKSRLSLASYTKLKVDRSFYDEASKKRDTVLDLLLGKARFLVEKVSSEAEEDYQINTPLSVIGIRGSDFVLAIVPEDEIIDRNSSWRDFFDFAHPAYAQGAGLGLAVVTGANTNLNLTPFGGSPISVPSFSFSGSGFNLPPVVFNVTPSLVPGALGGVGGGPAVMSMPEIFE